MKKIYDWKDIASHFRLDIIIIHVAVTSVAQLAQNVCQYLSTFEESMVKRFTYLSIDINQRFYFLNIDETCFIEIRFFLQLRIDESIFHAGFAGFGRILFIPCRIYIPSVKLTLLYFQRNQDFQTLAAVADGAQMPQMDRVLNELKSFEIQALPVCANWPKLFGY